MTIQRVTQAQISRHEDGGAICILTLACGHDIVVALREPVEARLARYFRYGYCPQCPKTTRKKSKHAEHTAWYISE